MDTDPYERLANAVIIQAARDYLTARRQLKRHLGNEPVRWRGTGENPCWQKWDEKRKDIVTGINELHDFFHSEWFMTLSDADGPALFERLRKEADARER